MQVANPSDREKRPNIETHLVEQFEYKIQINEDGGIPGLKRACRNP